MVRQSTLFGGVVELPLLKRRQSGSSGSGSSEDIRKKRDVFKDGWKEKAPWPQLQGVNLPDRVQAELLCHGWSTKQLMVCTACCVQNGIKYRVGVLLLGRMSHVFS